MNQQFIGTKPISENLFDKDKLEDFLKKMFTTSLVI